MLSRKNKNPHNQSPFEIFKDMCSELNIQLDPSQINKCFNIVNEKACEYIEGLIKADTPLSLLRENNLHK